MIHGVGLGVPFRYGLRPGVWYPVLDLKFWVDESGNQLVDESGNELVVAEVV